MPKHPFAKTSRKPPKKLQFQPTQWFDRLDSTNAHLQQMFRENHAIADGTVIAAREQSKGRGRNNRSWLSVAGKDLTFSFLLRTQMDPTEQVALPLVVGLAVATSMETLLIQPRLKWPNDILVNGKKLAGLLVEKLNNPESGESAIIVGIGVNINTEHGQISRIDQPATSLILEKDHEFPLTQVLDVILSHLARWIDTWEAEGFDAISPAWLQRCEMLNNEISVTDTSGKVIKGTMSGLGPQGQLLLTDQAGVTHTLWSGDVTLRS